ncbi:reticulon-4 receptor [Latimeria chalumnae]|uniref:LRRCT domain-containing protein n=1 Tax=Latimeria chalumnae TaxID=7897 RepID=M3XJU6_LATCH
MDPALANKKGRTQLLCQSVFLFAILARILGNCDKKNCEFCAEIDPKGMSVSCTHKNLTRLPNLPFNVYDLQLSHNKFTILTTGMFDKTELVKKLQFLSLDYNTIIAIQRGAFLGIIKLERLDLSHNINLKTINNSTFSPLSELRYLNLQNTGLVSLSQDAFLSLFSLKSLQLSVNHLSKIPPKIFAPTQSITSIDLSKNNIASFDDRLFSGLFLLTNLSLSHNSIDHIKDFSFQTQENLKRLELNDNHLNSIDVHLLEPMVWLKILKLDGNPWDCSCLASTLCKWIHVFEGNVTGPFCSTPQFLVDQGELGHFPLACYQYCPKVQPNASCIAQPTSPPPLHPEVLRLGNLVNAFIGISTIALLLALGLAAVNLVMRYRRHGISLLQFDDS